MSRHFRPLNLDAIAYRSIIVEATRCWRKARDTGQAVQPCLYQVFASHDCEMLAPVFDSLMSLCENALGRPVVIGSAMALSEDESMLLGLLDGSRQRCTCIDCLTDAAASLDCAISSTQVLIGTPILAGLDLSGGWQIVRQTRSELRGLSEKPRPFRYWTTDMHK